MLKPRTLALLLFVLVLAASGFLLLVGRPLKYLGGLTDEWFVLGRNVAVYRTLGWGTEPMVLRAPGYPAFIAAVLWTTTRVPAEVVARSQYSERAAEMVYLAQALLLAATTSLLFAWLRTSVSLGVAFTAAVLYGLNPYSLVLPGMLHYDVLHLFLLVAGCAALDGALGTSSRTSVPLAATGALWGAIALVRAVALPMPLFVLGMIRARGLRGRRAIEAAVMFSCGMAAVIAPWTLRNFHVTGTLIPVNLQGWASIWASTAEPLRLDPNEYQWRSVGALHMQPIVRRVTGRDYDYLDYVRHNVAIEAAFRQDALQNIRRQPRVYLWNVTRGLVSFAFQINTSLVSVFERVQRTGETVGQDWFWSGAEHERRETAASRAFSVLAGALTVLAGGGLAWGLARRDAFVVVPGLAYLCVTLAHAITFLDLTYYYQKLPFLIIFAALGLETLRERGWALTLGRRRVPVAGLVGAALLALALGGTIAVLRAAAISV